LVLFLFLAHLGLGILFTLAFVSRDAGVKFFRFNAGLAAILIAGSPGWRRVTVGVPRMGSVLVNDTVSFWPALTVEADKVAGNAAAHTALVSDCVPYGDTTVSRAV